MSLSNVIYININDCFVEKKRENDSDLDAENLPCHNEDGKIKYLQKNWTQLMPYFYH